MTTQSSRSNEGENSEVCSKQTFESHIAYYQYVQGLQYTLRTVDYQVHLGMCQCSKLLSVRRRDLSHRGTQATHNGRLTTLRAGSPCSRCLFTQ